MNKIIQLLRLSRLVLLVILLLITVAAKIARAETALMYYVYQQQALGYFGTPQAACSATDKPMFRPVQNDRPGNSTAGYCRKYDKEPSYSHYTVMKSRKTCEAKELTHNGSELDYHGSGSELLNNVFWLDAPSGIDAKDWYSDRFNTCENNCVVLNSRHPLFSKSVNEADGTSRSAFTKRQTGSVCVVEKKKPDDPPKPPPPDTGDSADGSGQSNSGTGNGQGDGSNNGQGGSGTGSDSSQAGGNGGEGNPDSPDGSGSGGGSGGSSGGSLQIGPGGGGTGGGAPGGSEAGGSESGTGDGQSGSGQSGSGSGNEGGQGGADGSGEGVDGDGEAGGHYFPCPSGKGSYKKGSKMKPECSGEGDGDGKGSIGGGSCEADTPPDCKGDPIQCYIAREQWRTACAALGKGNKIEGDGNCRTGTPPDCKGDATQCYMVKNRWQEACARAELESYGRGEAAGLEKALGESGDPEGVIGDNSSTINLPGQLDTAGFGWTRTCPISSQIDLGIFGKHDWFADRFCTIANFVGQFLVLLTLIASARYIL